MYYEGYELDCNEWELTNEEINILNAAILLVDNHWSIRKLARNILKSKSQVHRDLHKVRALSYELYQCVKRTLKENKQ